VQVGALGVVQAVVEAACGRATLHKWEHSGLRGGWSHIVPRRFGGNGFTDLLFYQPSTGTGEFYSINSRGGMDSIRSYGDWGGSWTHIVSGNFGGGPQSDLLFYDGSTGKAELRCVDNSGRISLLNTISNWGPWTHLVA
jgi:hypothetical protein